MTSRASSAESQAPCDPQAGVDSREQLGETLAEEAVILDDHDIDLIAIGSRLDTWTGVW